MPDTRPFATCDVFTEAAFEGNPLAIVEDAEGLSDAAMQTIAKEFNLSETIFVLPPRDPAHTARVRIFFPAGEIPFAGHPTIGCAIHLALKTAGDGDFDRRILLEEEAGPVSVSVTRRGARVSAELQAPVLPHRPIRGTTADTALLARALGLTEEEIGFAGHVAGLWQAGPAFLYVPLRDLAALGAARPMEPAWSEVMARGCVDSAYLYTPSATGCLRARMFSPTAGIPEDPATGSAAAILAGPLMASGKLTEGENSYSLLQGVEMGRPSRIGLRIQIVSGGLHSIHISGSAVPISHGHLRVPDRCPPASGLSAVSVP